MNHERPLRLGEHTVRFAIERCRGGYMLLQWIGYDGRWDDSPGYYVPERSRRRCRRLRNRVLKRMQRSRAF